MKMMKVVRCILGANALGFALAVSAADAVQAVWIKGRSNEMNGYYGFVAAFDYDGVADAQLTWTAASLARVWINGQFAGYGPARAPEGFARREECAIARFLKKGANSIAFEVLSPRVNAFDLMDRPPFLRAEVVVGGKSVVRTGRDFKATALNRVTKTSRFSYQRGLAEVLDIRRGCDDWRTAGIAGAGLPLEAVCEETILPRGTAYPKFEIDRSFHPTIATTFRHAAARKDCPTCGMIAKTGQGPLKGYRQDELAVNVHAAICNCACQPAGKASSFPIRLESGKGVVLEGATEVAGFVQMKLRATKPSKLWLTMGEYAGTNGIPNPLRMWMFTHAFGYRVLEPGEYAIENFDVTAFKAAHLMVDEGAVELCDFSVRTFGNPNPDRARFHSPDPKLDAVFEAAKRSLKWNSADFYTDCPGRERGIYFGDTIFTGRAGDVLMGDLAIERSMFEAFALPKKFPEGVPDGMVPMLYPGDTTLSSPHWIPNFGMWSVVQLADHVRRIGNRAAAEAYRTRAMNLLAWFRACRNADGLLEKIPGWVFVEWSDADKFTQDVSYLTNMTYVKFLDAMAELYGLADCAAEAEKARATIRRQSWTGEWFSDNAVRQSDGTLKTSGSCTEAAQYFAFFSGVATPERDPALWKRVVEELGPMRKPGAYPKLYPSNMLFGYSIRFVLLSEAGLSKKVLEEVRHCYYPMASKTGTLWEATCADKGYSCCHGFPSMAAWLLARDALGVKRIDRVNKVVHVAVPNGNALNFCEGTLPVSATEEVTIRWRQEWGHVKPAFDVPKGWRIDFKAPVEGDRSTFGPLASSAKPVAREEIWPAGKMPYFQEKQVAEKTAIVNKPGFDRAAHRAPYIEWYVPDAAHRTATCVIFVSGGGFFTCCDASRLQPAIDRFVRAGVTVANLTYRTPRPEGLPIHQSAWADLQRAVRVVRSHAAERGFSPDRIGATGISAGAKAVLLVALSSRTAAYERVDALDDLPCRLAFAIPQAPAYVLTDGATGPNTQDGAGAAIVPELKFDEDTAPLCCLQGGIDEYSPLGSVRLYQRLAQKGVPAELHLFANRWHGFHGDANRGADGTAWDHWCERMLDFVALFEPRLQRAKEAPCAKSLAELKACLRAQGLPDVLVCGKGEEALASSLPEEWLARRRCGEQCDLHIFAKPIDDDVRAKRYLEFARHAHAALLTAKDFRIRDPFILVEDGRYYLYESHFKASSYNSERGVYVRESANLVHWSEPTCVMALPPTVDCHAVWAPEVHKYKGAYWLFTTLTQSTNVFKVAAMSKDAQPQNLKPRGTWVFKADSPRGPFKMIKDGPVPPRELMTLDGTLYVEDGTPYMAYCHEWCQLATGTIEYAPMNADFTAFTAAPKTLLDAHATFKNLGVVTDGVFFWRSEKSKNLYMIWSNFLSPHGYVVMVRRSASGKIAGPWSEDRLLFTANGGHGMIFKDLHGKLQLSIHCPQRIPDEHLLLCELVDDGEGLTLAK